MISLQLSFEAITGESWDSDVALDEITWEIGSCSEQAFTFKIKFNVLLLNILMKPLISPNMFDIYLFAGMRSITTESI